MAQSEEEESEKVETGTGTADLTSPPDRLIERGVVVEAQDDVLGESDVSKPKVEKVVRDAQGQLEEVVVKKGVIFQKEIIVPANRLQTIEEEVTGVDHDHNKPDQAQYDEKIVTGKIGIKVEAAEIEQLKSGGKEEALLPATDLITRTEQTLPTESGLRELEEQQKEPEPEPADQSGLLAVLGPGFLAGMAGNDSSAVTAYAVDGATNGYGHLWLLLLSTPLYQAVQFACSKVGRVSHKGLSELLKDSYGGWVAGMAALLLIIANIALIAADLVAVGSAIELMTGLSWVWFVTPVALLLWYITVYQNFDTIKKIFLVMSLAFATYLVTAVLSKPDWGAIVSNTFIPKLDFNFTSISSAVALLGATISPYNLYWQVQGQKEEKRTGSLKKLLRLDKWDVGSGVLSGNLVAYAIIVCASATIFTHHGQINTAADAAKSLEPLVGSFAKYLFAFGLIGAGLIAIPVLLASTSYAISGTVGWSAGLSRKPWQSEGFYLILSGALVIGVIIALSGFDPIQLMFWANVLNGVLAPVLVTLLLLAGNNSKVMGQEKLTKINSAGLIITILVMTGATVLLFYGLFTGAS